MGKDSIPQSERLRKEELRGTEARRGGGPESGDSGEASARGLPHRLRAELPPGGSEDGGRGTKRRSSAAEFTASELAELAGFDAALDAEEIFLTPEERRLSRELDRVARAEAEPEDGDGDGLPRRSAPRNDGKSEDGGGDCHVGLRPPRNDGGDGGASAFGHHAGKDLSTACGGPPPLSGEARKKRKPETEEQRAARLEKKRLWREEHREQLRLSSARYNEAHRQERRDYQKVYDAAHKAEISARRRKKDADGKQKEKGHG